MHHEPTVVSRHPRVSTRATKSAAPRKYAADDARTGLAHAMLAVATIGRGRVVSLDTTAARAVQGVLLVLTHDDFAGVKLAGYLVCRAATVSRAFSRCSARDRLPRPADRAGRRRDARSRHPGGIARPRHLCRSNRSP